MRERVEVLCREWLVRPERFMDTPSSVVVFGKQGGRSVVVKVVKEPHEEWNVGEVLGAFAGCGMVRALENVPGAVLLEALDPGIPLASMVEAGQDHDATEVLVGIVEDMMAVVPSTRGYPAAEEWASGFDWYFSRGSDEIPIELVWKARETYLELCRTQREVRLLHGDLQHYNVLLDQKRGWLAIDPKGVVAELEFELGAPMRNPHARADLFRPPVIERRVTQFADRLGVDAARVIRWTFSQAVLSAIWLLEDEGILDQDTPVLSLAYSARSLLA